MSWGKRPCNDASPDPPGVLTEMTALLILNPEKLSALASNACRILADTSSGSRLPAGELSAAFQVAMTF